LNASVTTRRFGLSLTVEHGDGFHQHSRVFHQQGATAWNKTKPSLRRQMYRPWANTDVVVSKVRDVDAVGAGNPVKIHSAAELLGASPPRGRAAPA
jgi:hypothetical protein